MIRIGALPSAAGPASAVAAGPSRTRAAPTATAARRLPNDKLFMGPLPGVVWTASAGQIGHAAAISDASPRFATEDTRFVRSGSSWRHERHRDLPPLLPVVGRAGAGRGAARGG